MTRESGLKRELRLYFESKYTGGEADKDEAWERCWAFLWMNFPSYGFRAASTYFYAFATSAKRQTTPWATKGKDFYERMKTTIAVVARGEITVEPILP